MQFDIPKLEKKAGTSLVLGGGGTKAFYFHLGVMRALGLNDVTSIVGSSAGAVTGGLVAAGIDVETIITALDRTEVTVPKTGAKFRFVGSRLLFNPALKQIAAQSIQNLLTIAGMIAALPILRNQDVLAEAIDRLYTSQQTVPGFFEAGEIEAMMKSALASNEFSDLEIDLYITATALDTHERAVFNAKYAFKDAENQFRNDVPVYHAVRASTSLPALFEPAMVFGKPYIDGEITQALSMDIGLALADRVVVSHIYQPLLQKDGDSLRDSGWLNILRQSFHLIMNERALLWREIYAQRYPEKSVLWIAPDPEDREFFLAPEFSFRPAIQQYIIRCGEEAAKRALAKSGQS